MFHELSMQRRYYTYLWTASSLPRGIIFIFILVQNCNCQLKHLELALRPFKPLYLRRLYVLYQQRLPEQKCVLSASWLPSKACDLLPRLGIAGFPLNGTPD